MSWIALKSLTMFLNLLELGRFTFKHKHNPVQNSKSVVFVFQRALALFKTDGRHRVKQYLDHFRKIR
jgi:hypothetical protein